MAQWNCGRSRSLKIVAATLFAGVAAFSQTAKVAFEDGAFRLSGSPAVSKDAAPPADGWQSLLSVYAGAGDTPMLGKYRLEGTMLVFEPRFPLADGVTYRAVYPGGVFTLDRKAVAATPSTRIAHVYPSSDVLPANELKLYLYFSAPMSRGEAWQHVHLLNEDDTPVALAFLQLDQELWDPGNTRLTILFDPGRIKRGLVSTNDIGSPIVEGRHYKLVVDNGWHDARGVTLAEGFTKAFTGAPSDRTPPDPRHWMITAPKAGTSDPLTIEFPKSMDYALLQRMIEIPDVPGVVTVDRNETRWLFTPAAAWKPGKYRAVADNTLEDIAGNHLDRAFDVDLSKIDSREDPLKTKSSPTISVPFTIR